MRALFHIVLLDRGAEWLLRWLALFRDTAAAQFFQAMDKQAYAMAQRAALNTLTWRLLFPRLCSILMHTPRHGHINGCAI